MKQVNKTEFIRVEKTKNYTVIHNQFLRRKDLSWKAKGILAYILSLPDDWNINIDELMTHATDGRSSFRSGWKELREVGYVKRKPVKDEQTKKILHWETVVRESVDMTTSKPHTENPPSGKPVDGKPDGGKSNTTKYLKELSTNKLNTNKDHSPAKAEHIPHQEIIEYLNEKADRSFNYKAKGNRDLIKARWNEDYDLDDFKQAIDNKVAHANDPNYFFTEEYLRPSTLFRKSNFDEYVNAVVKSKKTKVSNDDNVNFNELSELLGE